MDFIQMKIRLFARIRRAICPFDRLIEQIPDYGHHLDLGCGYGIFCSLLSEKRPNMDITGIELDNRRVEIARERFANDRIHFLTDDVTTFDSAKEYDSITCIDLLHHIPSSYHENIIRALYSSLKDDGIVVIKDMDKQPFLKYLWNYGHDIVMSRSLKMHYTSKQELRQLLEENGFFIVDAQDIHNFLYAHYYIACKKARRCLPERDLS